MATGAQQCIKGKVPEEDKTVLPGRPQGSHHLPWDIFSIPTKTVRVPEAGGWGGEFVSAKTAGGGFWHGVTTNATAKNRNVRRSCVAGRQPSGSRNAVPTLKDAGNMPRQNGSDGSGRHLSATCRRKAKPQPLSAPSLRVVTQQKDIPKSFVIAPDAMSPSGSLVVRLPRTAATTAVRP